MSWVGLLLYSCSCKGGGGNLGQNLHSTMSMTAPRFCSNNIFVPYLSSRHLNKQQQKEKIYIIKTKQKKNIINTEKAKGSIAAGKKRPGDFAATIFSCRICQACSQLASQQTTTERKKLYNKNFFIKKRNKYRKGERHYCGWKKAARGFCSNNIFVPYLSSL